MEGEGEDNETKRENFRSAEPVSTTVFLTVYLEAILCIIYILFFTVCKQQIIYM
jgi:hypothetical protein